MEEGVCVYMCVCECVWKRMCMCLCVLLSMIFSSRPYHHFSSSPLSLPFLLNIFLVFSFLYSLLISFPDLSFYSISLLSLLTGSDYTDSFCNISSLVREIVSLTGLDFDGNAPETVVEKRNSFDSNVQIASSSGIVGSGSDGISGGEKIDGVTGNDVLENMVVEGDRERERIGEGEGRGVSVGVKEEVGRREGEEKSSMIEEDEEEEEGVSDAVARLINDVSPTLTHIDDLPGKTSILNTLNYSVLC